MAHECVWLGVYQYLATFGLVFDYWYGERVLVYGSHDDRESDEGQSSPAHRHCELRCRHQFQVEDIDWDRRDHARNVSMRIAVTIRSAIGSFLATGALNRASRLAGATTASVTMLVSRMKPRHPKEQESAWPVPRATRNQASRNNEESAEQGELEQPADESFDYQHMNTFFSLLGDSVA